MPNEHLYGRAGYLAAVMFVQKHLGADSIKKEVIASVGCGMGFSSQQWHMWGQHSCLEEQLRKKLRLNLAHLTY